MKTHFAHRLKFVLGTLYVIIPLLGRSVENSYTNMVLVTATREAKLLREVPESTGILEASELEFIAPAHPSEALNRIAGVHINNVGGEGHMTAIRQPITTGGVYLFLEDGIPTRPTGLFNHNALYEINVPQADRIEIIKGPGSALYGSDSIGGIINSITKPSPSRPKVNMTPEIGSYGWNRFLATGGAPLGDHAGFRIDLNLTENEGYRDASEYRRYSGTGRMDGLISETIFYKTLFSYSQIEQQGVSSLEEADYRNNTTKNLYHNDVGRRDVAALRFSTEIAYEPNSEQLYTLTPFFRDNKMVLMPSWMLSYDPNDRDYRFQSYGTLAKYRLKIPEHGIELIVGTDVDYTPSTYREVRLSTTKDGDLFIDTSKTGRTNYDFDANQLSFSPYVHGEWQVMEPLRLTGGLRYDYFQVRYTDNLPSSIPEQQAGFGGFNHLRPDSQTISYEHLNPKVSLIYTPVKEHNLYANYRHSFRVPSIGQLFRSGSTANTADLDPVQTDSVEIGARGQWFDWLQYDAALYHMIVNDDIVNYIDTVSGDRKVANAGETTHQGIELGLQANVTDEWSFSTAWSFSNQEYQDYTALVGFPPSEINYGGNAVGKAPKTLGNLAVQYRPLYFDRLMLEFEWEHLGNYYTDETNTQEYKGHDLLNLRASLDLTDTIQIYARVMNVMDTLYSAYTSNQVGVPDVQYRPGLPRRFYLGVRAEF